MGEQNLFHTCLDNIKKKQGFTSIDIIMCLSAIVALALLVVPILVKNSSYHTQDVAMKRAKSLSVQVLLEIQSAQKQANKAGQRQIASLGENGVSMEGIVGTDPWGNPYHYRVLKDLYGQPTHLVVWSRGSNSLQDTSEYEFNSQEGEVHFSGDDLGYIVPVSTHG